MTALFHWIIKAGLYLWLMLTSQPLLRVEGEYILLADRRGKDAYLINKGNVISKINTDDAIITASISETGQLSLLRIVLVIGLR